MLVNPDRHLVVTGSRGALGRAVVAMAEGQGIRVSAIDRTEALAGEDFIDRIDLACPLSATDAMRLAIKRHGPIDALCNACGMFESGTVMEASPELWLRLFLGNVMTTLNACRAAIPYMTAGGGIVNVAATAGFRAEAGMGAYSAAKAGVMRLTEALKIELKDRGIEVRCLLPQVIDTPRNRREMPEADWSRWESVEEVAARMLFMAGLPSESPARLRFI